MTDKYPALIVPEGASLPPSGAPTGDWVDAPVTDITPKEIKSSQPLGIEGDQFAAGGGMTPLAPFDPPEAAAQSASTGDVFDAMLKSTPTANAFRYMTEPLYPADPNYNPMEDTQIKGTPYEQLLMSNFLTSQSAAESASIIREYNAETGRAATLSYARGGVLGVAAGLASGLLDPSILIPLGGWVKGGIAVGRGARMFWGAVDVGIGSGIAAGIQEGVLQATTETRTARESVFAIGGSVLLGGILGVASRGLSREVHAELSAKIEDHMNAPEVDPVLRAALEKGDVDIMTAAERTAFEAHAAAGAQIADLARGSGAQRGSFGVQRLLRRLSPKARVQTSEMRASRLAGADLYAGNALEENYTRGIATSEGGSVESRVAATAGDVHDILQNNRSLFNQYRFGKQVPLGPTVAALQRFSGKTEGKLSYPEFREAITDAWLAGDEHAIPEVAAVAKYAREHGFNPPRDEAIALRMDGYHEGMKPQSGDKGYMPRQYNRQAIIAKGDDFNRVVVAALKRAQTKAREKIETWRTDKLASLQEQIADLELSGEARASTLAALEAQQKVLREGPGKTFAPVDQRLEGLRASHAAARTASPTTQATADAAVAVKAEVERAGQAYADYVTQRNALASRLRRVRGNVVGRENQVEALRAKIADVENANVDRLYRMHSAITKLEGELQGMTPEAVQAELASLRTDFAQVLERSTKAQDRVAAAKAKRAEELKTAEEAGDLKKAGDLKAELNRLDPFVAEAKNIDEMSKLAERIGEVEEIDPELATFELRALIEKRLAQSAQVVEDAGRHLLGLTERLKQANPDLVRSRVAALKERVESVKDRPGGQLAEMTDQELAEVATGIRNNIVGLSPSRMALPNDLAVAGPRGPLKERVMNFVTTQELKPFLNWDSEELLHRYVRTMATDVNLVRKFGSTDMKDQIQKIIDEGNAKKVGKSEKEQARINKVIQNDVRDIAAMRDILRGTYRLPANPDGLLHRTVMASKTLNFLSSLGMMTVSSISDLAKPVFVHGLTRNMRTAFVPFAGGMKAYNLARRDVKAAGIGIDMIAGDRVLAMNELAKEYTAGTMFERGLSKAGRAFGFLTLMNPWNATMKQFAGVITISRTLEDIEHMVAGKIGAKERGYLAEGGITESLAAKIHEQVQLHGGGDSAVRWAATGAWDVGKPGVAEARRALHAFINRDVERTIVTPGIGDKPLGMHGDLGSMIGQFQSFAIASVQHTLVSGLQQRDLAAFNGMMLMLGWGAVSYKLKSDLAGIATSDDPTVWAAEALDNSGLLGVLMNADHIVEKITDDRLGISALTGKPFRRYTNVNKIGSFLGPSFGKASDILDIFSAVSTGNVTQSTIHKARKMVPLQNLAWARWMFNRAETGISNTFGIPTRQ